MDRSMDSIGSCSLDVEADSTDVSDTSGSLNFPTPISIKDITREFTVNMRKRCSVHSIQEINKSYTSIESTILLKQPLGNVNPASALQNLNETNVIDGSDDKKPSYLNLACCVNGYSNLTTYDSKIRQDINKSREVSPIRPSSNSIQYCKKNNSLAPPILLQMNDLRRDFDSAKSPAANGNGQYDNTGPKKVEKIASDLKLQEDNRNTSFIQQRVERLYGPAALAQGFYSPKKVRSTNFVCMSTRNCEDASSSELTLKFQQLTPSKDYTEFRKKLSASNAPRQILSFSDTANINTNSVDLPVLRHLSQEFRAQLPISSTKKTQSRNSSNKSLVTENEPRVISTELDVLTDEVDRKENPKYINDVVLEYTTNGFQNKDNISFSISDLATTCVKKDGCYFLSLLKSEQTRLLNMADLAEQYAKELSDNPEVSEDILGFLRSAYGKARLLVSQKMKQFEGLCQNNLNLLPDDKFPTTNDDLQGFWDMVNLQVDDINSIFEEIDLLKINNWKKPVEELSNKPNKLSQKSIKAVNQKAKPNISYESGLKSNTAKSAASSKRESQRKMLMEMKRKNKIALAARGTEPELNSLESHIENVETVEIFVKPTK